MFRGAPNAPITDFNEALNRFKEDLSRSLESMGVQIKPNRNAYHKSYPSSWKYLMDGGYRIFIKRDGVTEEVLYLQLHHLGLLVITMLRNVVEIREDRESSSSDQF
jgi:hypothetical protein